MCVCLGPDPRPGADARQLNKARPRAQAPVREQHTHGCGNGRDAEKGGKQDGWRREGTEFGALRNSKHNREGNGTARLCRHECRRRERTLSVSRRDNGGGAPTRDEARTAYRRHCSGSWAPFTFPATGCKSVPWERAPGTSPVPAPFPGNQPCDRWQRWGPGPGPPRTRPSWCPPRMATHAAGQRPARSESLLLISSLSGSFESERCSDCSEFRRPST
jgi:hypothetical protein